MYDPEAVYEHTRSRLLDLIEHEFKKTGSVEIARMSIARRLRVSRTWIKRIVGRYAEPATIQTWQSLNLEELHREVSARLGNRVEWMERKADEARAEALRLEGDSSGCVHEIFESSSSLGLLAGSMRHRSNTA